jgi:hypothetical protein
MEEKAASPRKFSTIGWSSTNHLAFLALEAWQNLTVFSEELLHPADGQFQVRFNSS